MKIETSWSYNYDKVKGELGGRGELGEEGELEEEEEEDFRDSPT